MQQCESIWRMSMVFFRNYFLFFIFERCHKLAYTYNRTYTNFLTVNGTNIVTNHSTHFSISSGSFSSVKFVIHLVHSLTFRIKSTKCKLLTCFTKLCKKSKTFLERSSIEVCILVCSGGNDAQDSRGVN